MKTAMSMWIRHKSPATAGNYHRLYPSAPLSPRRLSLTSSGLLCLGGVFAFAVEGDWVSRLLRLHPAVESVETSGSSLPRAFTDSLCQIFFKRELSPDLLQVSPRREPLPDLRVDAPPLIPQAHLRMNKGAWTKEEDQLLVDYIRKHGEGCWRSLPRAAGLQRCGKSCRLRWMNYLRPDLKRGNFTEEEDELIIKLHSLLGNKWSLIAGRLPGRTDNEIKNYWNTHIKRKLLSRGIDPNTHRPITESTISPSKTTTRPLQNDEHVPFDFAGPDQQRTVKPEPVVLDREEGNNNNNNNNCTSSGTTSEKDIQTDADWVLNLELSVGPTSYRYESTRKANPDSAESTRRSGSQLFGAQAEVCLCCRIGVHNESCRNCRISDVRTIWESKIL